MRAPLDIWLLAARRDVHFPYRHAIGHMETRMRRRYRLEETMGEFADRPIPGAPGPLVAAAAAAAAGGDDVEMR